MCKGQWTSVNARRKKWVFKSCREVQAWRWRGREFHSLGTATLNRLSPKVWRQKGGPASRWVSEDLSVSAGVCGRRRLGPRQCRDFKTRRSVLYCLWNRTGSYCNFWHMGVMYSCGPVSAITLPAGLCTQGPQTKQKLWINLNIFSPDIRTF